MTDIGFLMKLQKKLQVGNLRDIHLNALPGRYATRFDIYSIEQIREQLALSFIENLLKEKVLPRII